MVEDSLNVVIGRINKEFYVRKILSFCSGEKKNMDLITRWSYGEAVLVTMFYSGYH